jgi:hypothetical protein
VRRDRRHFKAIRFHGVEVVAIPRTDGAIVWIPAWMMDASAVHYKLCKEPRFSIDILRSLRAEVDALLGFLRSDSETEKDRNDAPIDQPSLFDEEEPRVVLAPAQLAELGTLVEALLLEIAAALANAKIADDQDHV